MPFPWTPATRERLRSLFFDQGKTQREVAEILNMEHSASLTASAISGQIRLLRESGAAPPPARSSKPPRRSPPKNAQADNKREPPPPPAVAEIDDLTAPLIIETGAPATIETINASMCRWVYGDPLHVYAFCGRGVASHGVYCPRHRALAYVKVAKREAVPSAITKKPWKW